MNKETLKTLLREIYSDIIANNSVVDNTKIEEAVNKYFDGNSTDIDLNMAVQNIILENSDEFNTAKNPFDKVYYRDTVTNEIYFVQITNGQIAVNSVRDSATSTTVATVANSTEARDYLEAGGQNG